MKLENLYLEMRYLRHIISEFLKIIAKQNSSQLKTGINRDIKQQNKFSTILYKNIIFVNEGGESDFIIY